MFPDVKRMAKNTQHLVLRSSIVPVASEKPSNNITSQIDDLTTEEPFFRHK